MNFPGRFVLLGSLIWKGKIEGYIDIDKYVDVYLYIDQYIDINSRYIEI